jgi:hypothetical protein
MAILEDNFVKIPSRNSAGQACPLVSACADDYREGVAEIGLQTDQLIPLPCKGELPNLPFEQIPIIQKFNFLINA